MGDVDQVIRMNWEIHSLSKHCTARLLTHQQIHFGQPPLLFTLKNKGACNQIDLAKALHISPASIAVSLKRMEKSGLIRRVPDPADLRSNRIELTEQGLSAAEQAQAAIRQVNRKIYQDFSPEEFDLFTHFYKRMRQNLSDYKNQLDETEESI